MDSKGRRESKEAYELMTGVISAVIRFKDWAALHGEM